MNSSGTGEGSGTGGEAFMAAVEKGSVSNGNLENNLSKYGEFTPK